MNNREATENQNWSGDKLERTAEARKLQNYLFAKYQLQKKANAPQNLVTSLRAPWGAGKTYLLTNWQQELHNNNYVCVLFDAWKNDFTKDPLVGLIATIETQLTELVSKNDKVLVSGQGVLEALKTVAKVGGAIVGKWGLGELGYGMIAEIAESGLSAIEKTYDPVKEHKARLDYMAKFKDALKNLVNQIEIWEGYKNLPLFIFIDELDRCRPTYAIEVLENIKHLFDVNGVYFVIATDLSELAHSVKAVYGEGFDAAKYLKRFFDLDYLLAEPSKKDFIANLFQQRGYSAFLDYVKTPFDSYNEKTTYDNMQGAFRAVCDVYAFNLRDIEQIALSFEAVMLTAQLQPRQLCLYYLIHLLCLRHVNPELIQQCSQMAFNNGVLPALLFETPPKRKLDSSLKIKDYHPNLGHLIAHWEEHTVLGVINEYKVHISEYQSEIVKNIRPPHHNPREKLGMPYVITDEICITSREWQESFSDHNKIPSPIGDYHKFVAELGQLSEG